MGSRHRAISIPTVGLHSIGERLPLNTGSYSPLSSLETDGVLSEGMKSRVDSMGKGPAHPQALVFFTWFERVRVVFIYGRPQGRRLGTQFRPQLCPCLPYCFWEMSSFSLSFSFLFHKMRKDFR